MGGAARAVLRVDRGWLALVLGLVAVDRLVMILRWWLLLRASNVALTAPEAARIFLIASFVGSFLPAGIGGDLARAYGVTRVTSEGSEAVASVAVDRVLGIIALAAMGLVGVVVTSAAADWRVGVGSALLVVSSCAVFWADRLFAVFFPLSWRRARAGARLLSLGAALSRYRERPATLLTVFAWSIGVQVLRVVQAYLLGLGLGIAVPFRYYLVFMPVGLLMLLLPVSISGFGVPQAAIVWLMRPLNVTDEQSLALSTLIVLTGLAGNLPGLVLWLAGREHRMRAGRKR